MQEHNIISYENLNDCQKEQAIAIFIEGLSIDDFIGRRYWMERNNNQCLLNDIV